MPSFYGALTNWISAAMIRDYLIDQAVRARRANRRVLLLSNDGVRNADVAGTGE
jgi:hypothetical protein